MSVRDDIYVTSFDIFWFDYTRRAKLLLDIYFPVRNLLVAGNSVCSLQTYFKKNPSYTPDLVFIDGGHERPIPFLDMYYILKQIPTNTWIIIDDYCKEHGEGGVLDGLEQIFGDIGSGAAFDTPGGFIGTVAKAINTYKNVKNLSKAQLASEAINILSNPGNITAAAQRVGGVVGAIFPKSASTETTTNATQRTLVGPD